MTTDSADGVANHGGRRPNQFPLPLKAAWIVYPGALILVAASPVSTEFGYALFGMLGALPVWIAMIDWSAYHFSRTARWRGWLKYANTSAVLFAATILAIIAFLPVIHTCNYFGGALRFAMTRSYYDQQVVALLPPEDKPRIAVFTWGGMIWASRGLVYDESDEIALPPGRQSAAWLAKVSKTELGCGNWSESGLWSHYYLVSFPC